MIKKIIGNRDFIENLRGKKATFLLAISNTRTADIKGITQAGIPDKIIKRASYILQKLEDGTFFEEELKERYAPIQLELIHIKKTYSTSSVSQNTNAKYEKIIEEIQNINPNTLTPIEALNVINKLKQLLDN
jgi:DNA mismatch repair ATPase MutS